MIWFDELQYNPYQIIYLIVGQYIIFIGMIHHTCHSKCQGNCWTQVFGSQKVFAKYIMIVIRKVIDTLTSVIGVSPIRIQRFAFRNDPIYLVFGEFEWLVINGMNYRCFIVYQFIKCIFGRLQYFNHQCRTITFYVIP